MKILTGLTNPAVNGDEYACLCCRGKIDQEKVYCGTFCRDKFRGKIELMAVEPALRRDAPLNSDEVVEALGIEHYKLNRAQLIEIVRESGNFYLERIGKIARTR
jgi:hypothetical protein